MAREPFLINPPRRRARKAIRRKRLSNFWAGHSSEHGSASKLGWGRRKKSRPGYAKPKGATFARSVKSKKNPFGEEVILVGLNPRRKRRRAKVGHRRMHRRKRAAVMANPRRRRWSIYKAASRKRRRKSNPIRARRRRHRSNPVSSMSIKRPLSLLMPIAVGIGAKMAVEKVPGMIFAAANMTDIKRLMVQTAIAILPQFGKKFVGERNANIWTLVAGVTIGASLLNKYVLKTTTALAGSDDEIIYLEDGGMGAYAAPGSLGAFPNDVVREYEEDLSY